LASALFPPAVPAINRRRPRCMRKGYLHNRGSVQIQK
jgi:hypothetical protein